MLRYPSWFHCSLLRPTIMSISSISVGLYYIRNYKVIPKDSTVQIRKDTASGQILSLVKDPAPSWTSDLWGFPKERAITFFELLVIRITNFWGLDWGPPAIQGNYPMSVPLMPCLTFFPSGHPLHTCWGLREAGNRL